MSKTVDGQFVSEITQKEKAETGQARPVAGGPAAAAQRHTGQPLTGNVISDIAKGGSTVIGDSNAPDGPAAMAQSAVSSVSDAHHIMLPIRTVSSQGNARSTTTAGEAHSGILDSSTISKVTDAEKVITGDVHPAKGGPTAMAQKHAGETINSETLRDVTEGEKNITGGDRVKGGPTSTLQR